MGTHYDDVLCSRCRSTLKEGGDEDLEGMYDVLNGKAEGDELGATDETLGERLAALTSAIDDLGDSEEEEEEEAQTAQAHSQAKKPASQLQNVSTYGALMFAPCQGRYSNGSLFPLRCPLSLRC